MLFLHCLSSRRQLPPEAALWGEPRCHGANDPVWTGAADAERAALQRVWEEHNAQKNASGKPGPCAVPQQFSGPGLGLWVLLQSSGWPPFQEACMGIRARNSVNVAHLDPVLGTGEKKHSSCLPSLFSSPGDTLCAFPCWLPCQVEGSLSLMYYRDSPVWSLAAKKKRAIYFQGVDTYQLGDGRTCRG